MATDKFDKGMKLRKQVLGAEYVERSMASADDFSMPMQELSTEYCWGHVWTRPGLALRLRRRGLHLIKEVARTQRGRIIVPKRQDIHADQ